jgi:peptide/nickel transport system substrate-binding protein
LQLAESFEPNDDATEWTVRLLDGVTWHDGKPLTADDVIYTLRRIGDPESAAAGKAKVASVDLANLTKVDDLTLTIPLTLPIADLAASFAIFYMAIIQDGATDEDLRTNPVGTGPFVFESLEPGENSLFTRNPNYWQEGRPYVDELVLEAITDPGARLNALLGDQVDMVEALEFAQAAAEKTGGRIVVAETSPGQIVPMTMRVDTPPFDDVRVRQAMRLIADREALVLTAQQGLGEINNDLFGKGLQFYNDQLPQREQDIDEARSLLRSAGAEGLTVELNTATVAPGMLESATAFAEMAKEAGVTVTLNRIPDSDFYGANYLTYVFGMTQWTSQPIPSWLDDAVVTGAAYNETAWVRPDFDALVADARGDLDEARRADKYFEIQQILWEEGGYLIWGQQPFLDGLSTRVGGFVPISAQALGNYNFRDYWLT